MLTPVSRNGGLYEDSKRKSTFDWLFIPIGLPVEIQQQFRDKSRNIFFFSRFTLVQVYCKI